MVTRINTLPRRYRWPLKWVFVGLTLLLVCYPHPRRLITNLERWRNPNALIEPDAPALQPLVAELQGKLPNTRDPQQVLKAVEQFVWVRIPYAFDWVTWGVVDYIPTVDEVLAKSREDCDGRAVIAASLLCKLGYHAELVSDFMHVWVKTDRGELMGPRPNKAVVGTDRGARINWSWRLLADFGDAMGYGIAVFPKLREVIVVVACWLALIGPRTGRWAPVAAALLLGVGWLILRTSGQDAWHPHRALQGVGAACCVAGILAQAWPRSRPTAAPLPLSPPG